MDKQTKNEMREEINRLRSEVTKLTNEIFMLENKKIPRWAYQFEGKEWVICNSFKKSLEGCVAVIQDNYPTVVANINSEDDLIIVRKAKTEGEGE